MNRHILKLYRRFISQTHSNVPLCDYIDYWLDMDRSEQNKYVQGKMTEAAREELERIGRVLIEVGALEIVEAN